MSIGKAPTGSGAVGIGALVSVTCEQGGLDSEQGHSAAVTVRAGYRAR
jgi:hypothetical protein